MAQKTDSTKKTSVTKKALNKGISLISTSQKDTILNEESIDQYVQFAGKIIRSIQIEQIGFEVSIYDTTKKVNNTVKNIANALHVDTRKQVIKKHLFIKSGEKLNPYKLADNERFLRDKDFILDSRFVVTPIEGTDSVDLLIITRDVFSLGGTIGGSFPTAPKVGVYDANINGRAQRLEYTALIDQDRNPKYGYSLLYRKSSLFGSLTNLELQFSQLNTGVSIGDESEYAFFTKIERQLISPYTRLAGGFEYSYNWSKNVYSIPDSIFLNYSYTILDSWMGYNFGIHSKMKDRNRKFLAVRYFNGYYVDPVDQENYLADKKYNDAYGYLGELSWYNQNFYKTRYVLGFGRTEDIPTGYSLGITWGYVKQLQVDRPYAAVKYLYGGASKKGNFYNVVFQTGGFLGGNHLEDAVIQTQASYFTKIFQMKRYKMRNAFSASYTQLFNQVTDYYLEINRNLIPGLRTDSLQANIRLSTHLETVVYTPWQFIGFRFAPFIAVDGVYMGCNQCVNGSDFYWGFSSGLRTRNENLIFGTIEIKATYIPYDEFGDSKISFSFKQNLRVKSSGIFARKPALIAYN